MTQIVNSEPPMNEPGEHEDVTILSGSPIKRALNRIKVPKLSMLKIPRFRLNRRMSVFVLCLIVIIGIGSFIYYRNSFKALTPEEQTVSAANNQYIEIQITEVVGGKEVKGMGHIYIDKGCVQESNVINNGAYMCKTEDENVVKDATAFHFILGNIVYVSQNTDRTYKLVADQMANGYWNIKKDNYKSFKISAYILENGTINLSFTKDLIVNDSGLPIYL